MTCSRTPITPCTCIGVPTPIVSPTETLVAAEIEKARAHLEHFLRRDLAFVRTAERRRHVAANRHPFEQRARDTTGP